MAINLAKISIEELTQLLQIARKEAAEIEVVSKPIDQMEREVRALRQNEPEARWSKFGFWLALFLIFGVVAIIVAFFNSLFSELKDEYATVLSLFIAFVPPFVIVYLMNRKKKRKYANWQKQITQLQERIESENVVLRQIFLRAADKLLNVPDEYCSTYALDAMLGYIHSFRAENWRECTALYEEQKHRGILEQDSKENLQLQHEMTQAAKRAANNAADAAFYAEQAARNTRQNNI